MTAMYKQTIDLLEERGVQLNDIVECVHFLQNDYHEHIDRKDLEEAVLSVLRKREVQHAILTGINIDMAVEEHRFTREDCSELGRHSCISYDIFNDEGLYGVDEVMAYGICNLYGSIAYTNFGYIDKVKPGIIGELNDERPNECHTFLDDLVGAVAAAAASKFAHSS